MAALVMVDPDTDGRRFVLTRARFLVVGRGDDCDIRIDGDSVSKHHARIVRNEDGWVVEELDSANGVFVNDIPVRRAVLREADFLRIGEVIFKFAGGPFERPLDSDPGDSNSGAPLMAFVPKAPKN
jgi:pSer/pThr/pTyr-binding forkhead associated (FHA) protein